MILIKLGAIKYNKKQLKKKFKMKVLNFCKPLRNDFRKKFKKKVKVKYHK